MSETPETPKPFAEPEDYANRSYDMGPWSDPALTVKLGEASRLIRAEYPRTDERITAEKLDKERVIDIVCAMVSRAVPLTDLGIPAGAETAQIGVDVFQQTLKMGPTGSGGSGAIYLTKAERRSLRDGGAWEVDLLRREP